MTRRIIVLADDFTGSTDIGNAFVHTGRTVRVHLNGQYGGSGAPTAGGAEPSAGHDVVEIFALKTRTSGVDEARSAVLGVLEHVGYRAEQDQLYFKYCSTFDSTDEGNIGPVLDALVEAAETDVSVVVPAFPDNGRTQYQGYLFVHDTLLSESSMRNHPLTPMRDALIPRVLQRQTRARCELVPLQTVRGPELVATLNTSRDAPGYLVVDAVSNEDLADISAAVQDHRVVSGGSGLAQNYPRVESGSTPIITRIESMGRVTIVGSQSSKTREQLAYVRKRGGAEIFVIDPAENVEAEVSRVSRWLESHLKRHVHVVIQRPERAAGSLPDPSTSERIEHVLARAAQIAFDLGTREFLVAGGESAGATLQSLEGQTLHIGPEIAPGIPWCRVVRTDGQQMNIALKSGNFGQTEFFIEAWDVISA